MKDNVHLRLLRSLQASELRRLKLFLKDKWPDLHRLLNQLSQHKPDYAPEKIDPCTIYERVYPDAAYDAVVFSKRKQALSDKITAFLLQEEMRDNTLLSKRLLMQRLAHRNHTGAYEDAAKKFERAFKKAPQSANALHQAFHYKLLQEYNSTQPSNDHDFDYLLEAKAQADKAFLFWQLFFALEAKTRKQYRAELDMPASIDFHSAYWRQYTKQEGSLLHSMYQLWMLYAGEAGIEAFQRLLETVKKQASRYGKQELIVLTRHLANYAIGQYNKGEVEYQSLLISIHKWAAERELFVEDGELEYQIFLNVVINACICKDMAFAETYIQEQQQYLPPEFRRDVVHMAKAYLHFHGQHFQDASQELGQVKKRKHYDIGIRWQSLMLRTVYSLYASGLTDFTEVERQCRAFCAFLRNDNYSLSEKRKNSYENLIYFVEQMAMHRIDVDPPPGQVPHLQNELRNREVIAKKWVKEELDRLQ